MILSLQGADNPLGWNSQLRWPQRKRMHGDGGWVCRAARRVRVRASRSHPHARFVVLQVLHDRVDILQTTQVTPWHNCIAIATVSIAMPETHISVRPRCTYSKQLGWARAADALFWHVQQSREDSGRDGYEGVHSRHL